MTRRIIVTNEETGLDEIVEIEEDEIEPISRERALRRFAHLEESQQYEGWSDSDRLEDDYSDESFA